jgi:hypothetical protein
MQDYNLILSAQKRTPWNKGKLIGAKPPLLARHVWSIRTRLQIENPIPVFERPVIFWGVAGPRFPIENQFNAVRQVTARDQHCASAIAMAATVICPDLPQCRLQPFSVRYCSPLIGEIRLASVGRFVGR